MRSLIPLSLLLTIFDSPVHAFIFPFHVRFGNVNPSSRRRSPVPVANIGNAQYVTNITVAGQTVPVLMDTGSSDLWVHFSGTVPTSEMKDTGKSITLSYAVGKASGNIQTTQVSMGNISVPDQAMLYVDDTSTFTGDIHAQGYDGLLGLGPNQGSVIYKKLKSKTDAGDTFLQRAFEANRSTDNYITILLDRKADPGETLTGQFTISELVPSLESITSMPKLDVETVNKLLKGDQHWQALTDKNQGIIGPDGEPIQMKSIVPKAPSGQYVAVIDSGFTFSQVPRDMSDAIYGRVRGAVYDSTNEWWLVPCGQYLNVSFNFGGKNYPIHPLDLVDDNFAKVDSTGKKVCIGSFQPITSAFSILGHYDMILGMSFLRSSYALLDFGKWIGTSGDQDSPFMQLLSTVDPVAARRDFVTVRLGGNDTISDPRWSILPANETVHSPVSAEEKKKKYQEMILSRWPYIFVGCLAFVVISVGFCVWRCCCRKRVKNAAGEPGTTGKKGLKHFFSKKGARESYVPLEAQRSVADLSAPAPYGYSKQAQPYPSYQNEQGGYRNSQQGYHGQHQV